MGSPTPRVAVITGASRGIGAGLVVSYRAKGWHVVANARSVRASSDPGVLPVAGDIADPATAELVIHRALDRYGRVDTLVNNAGLFISRPFTDYTVEDVNRGVAVNLFAFVNVTQRAVTEMVRSGGGHIVNITTTLVEQADMRVPSVLTALTKGGVSSATRSLAIEYASRGIRVNAVSPGIVQTGDPSGYRGLGAFHPLGRVASISDVVDAVLFLESASFVTGEILHVDGGQSAGH